MSRTQRTGWANTSHCKPTLGELIESQQQTVDTLFALVDSLLWDLRSDEAELASRNAQLERAEQTLALYKALEAIKGSKFRLYLVDGKTMQQARERLAAA